MVKVEPPIPTTFTPLLRRFTDERKREQDETIQLYEHIKAHHEEFKRYAAIPCELEPPTQIADAFLDTYNEMLALERYMFEMPAMDLERMDLAETVALRTFLRKKQYFFENAEQVRALLRDGVHTVLYPLLDDLPDLKAPSPFTIPLACALPKFGEWISKAYTTLVDDKFSNRHLFAKVTDRMYRNLCEASGIADPQKPNKVFKHAFESKLSPMELNDTYLIGTPFHALFKLQVPLKFTIEDRFSHMHVVGGSGAGKTQLLQHLILNDLKSDEAPALIIVDSQTDMIEKILKLALFRQRDLVHITPKDIHYPPALNVFDVRRDRHGQYTDVMKEQVTAGVIQTFDYLFTGLLGADLSAKQGVFFKFVARLMLSLPETMGRNATMLDMLQLMADSAPYQDAINRLPSIAKDFFLRDFPSKSFAPTKDQIRYRLNAILENPTLARLFTSETTRIDLFTELNNGSVILVDTAKDFLKGASADFGRIFISLVLQAVQERAAIKEEKRRAAFLIVDEAAEYFDSNISDLLTEARKYKLGCVFAHQFLEQCSASLKASFAANTSIKMIGGASSADARAFAPEMRTTSDFILNQPKLHFAAYMRHTTPQAVSIPIPAGELEAEPQLTKEEQDERLQRNRERVAAPSLSTEARVQKEEDSYEW